MTTNQFNTALTSFLGGGVFAFERAKMLAGDPAAALVYFNLGTAIGGMLPTDFDGLILPPDGAPNPFLYFTATEYGEPGDALRIFDFAVDWENPATSSFAERAESPLAVAAFNPDYPGRNAIAQPAGSCVADAALDAIPDRLMHRVAYRNLGTGQELLVLNHTVNVTGSTTCGTYQAGVRLYQLQRTAGAANPFAVAHQVTFAPDATSRWMASAASDHQGNLAVGYSAASSAVSPAIRFTGRLAGDPANTLQAEATLIAGGGSQTSTGNRWGDYSMVAVDPVDDCTFWQSHEYYSATSTVGWQTRIGNFKFAGCTASPRGALEVTVTNCDGGAPVAGAQVTAGGYFRSTSGSGVATLTPMAPGSYTVSATRPGYNTDSTGVVVTNGVTTQVELCIAGVPELAAASSALVAEGCGKANGAIDPGERVTVSLCVENQGGAPTAALVGRPLAVGGVVLPGEAQVFGAVSAGGGEVCRDFEFNADPTLACGESLAVELALSDGVVEIGTVSFDLGSAGLWSPLLTQSFDGVTAPALPAGWTAANASGTDVTLWATSAGGAPTPVAASAPNAAFVNDPATNNDKRLESPAIVLGAGPARLRFANNYDLEAGSITGYDGGVLELKIGGGAFTDIVAAGGAFVQNGYVKPISGSFGSVLAGRQAWSGVSGGFLETIASLPPGAASQSIQLRFRMASDNTVADTGWRIDDVAVEELSCCAGELLFVADHEESNVSEWSTSVGVP